MIIIQFWILNNLINYLGPGRKQIFFDENVNVLSISILDNMKRFILFFSKFSDPELLIISKNLTTEFPYHCYVYNQIILKVELHLRYIKHRFSINEKIRQPREKKIYIYYIIIRRMRVLIMLYEWEILIVNYFYFYFYEILRWLTWNRLTCMISSEIEHNKTY